MLHLEVLHVDALGAESLEDSREHARSVGKVHAHAMERTRILVGGLEQTTAVAARLADPACEKPCVAARERVFELLDAAAVLGERGGQCVTVLEEDVDPDTWVRARDAGHVTQRPACGGERIVPVDSRRAGLVQEDVRERVRQVARHGDEPVVRGRVDSEWPSPE